jgi:hypothetical protein
METITKDDLRQLRMLLLHDVEEMLDRKLSVKTVDKSGEKEPEWLRSKAIRDILCISPATLQNLRVTGKIRFKKIMGTYYYSRTDLNRLFKNDGK